MKIRVKIFLVVLPLIFVSLCLAEAASYFQAVNGVTRIARQFFGFKQDNLRKYAENQWALLVENNYAGRPDMAAAAKEAVEIYARSIVLSDTEIIFALDSAGTTAMSTSPIELRPEEKAPLLALLAAENQGLINITAGGEKRAASAFYFSPFQWYILLSEKNSVFYRDANQIALQTVITLGLSLAVSVILLIAAARHLTNPLDRIVKAMNRIIETADLSSRVAVEYQDETGRLAHTFNLMIGELDRAYSQIKRYAFNAALKGKEEQRIRQIFQKYVPKDIINRFISNPAAMYKGENRTLAILFSDIRGFTTISEGMKDPAELVDSLNRYFSGQVDIIYRRNGIVDKYIGDAIMAFWGAPAEHGDDARQSVLSGLDMIGALAGFNENQKRLGKPEFHIGVGINYGEVTVGNIGSERKMDYTVIGDNVNLASRMEGLTKIYHAELLITESLYAELSPGEEPLFFRLLDTVAVKGKSQGVKIYTVKRALSGPEAKAWPLHNAGMELYYRRSFREAAMRFREVNALIPGDFNAVSLFKRCAAYAANPPPENWNGVEVMQNK